MEAFYTSVQRCSGFRGEAREARFNASDILPPEEIYFSFVRGKAGRNSDVWLSTGIQISEQKCICFLCVCTRVCVCVCVCLLNNMKRMFVSLPCSLPEPCGGNMSSKHTPCRLDCSMLTTHTSLFTSVNTIVTGTTVFYIDSKKVIMSFL